MVHILKCYQFFYLIFCNNGSFWAKIVILYFKCHPKALHFFTIYNIILIVLPSSISKYSFFKELYKLVKVKKKPEEKANGPLKAKACAK